MFLKLLVSFFSVVVLVKNFSYAKYEYTTNNNKFGATSIAFFSFVSIIVLNVVLFVIRF